MATQTQVASEMLPWAATMLAYNARPGDPAVLGDAWRDARLERLEATGPYAHTWLAHQRRDAYWQHGSSARTSPRSKYPSTRSGAGSTPTGAPSSGCSNTSTRNTPPPRR
nr:hypothetical protein [Streptomyces reniochalinae]